MTGIRRKRNIHRRGRCGRRQGIFIILILIPAIVCAFGSGKSKREELNKEFIDIKDKMEEAFDNGDFHGAIQIYHQNCCKEAADLKTGTPAKEIKRFKKVAKEIRGHMYQMLLHSYTGLDRVDMAEFFLRKLLVMRRSQGTVDYWPIIRETAARKYFVAPRLLVGLNLGTNFTVVHPGTRYSIMQAAYETDGNPYDKEYDFHFNYSRGTRVGFILEYVLFKNLRLNIQPAMTILKFQYRYHIKWEQTLTPIIMEFLARHRLSYIEIPLLLEYQLASLWKFKPYVKIGGFFQVRTSAFKRYYQNYHEQIVATPEHEPYEPSLRFKGEVSIRDQVNRFNGGIWLGAGVAFDIRGIRLEICGNYKQGFDNIINGEQRWKNESAVYTFLDVFDDLKVRNWNLSLSVLLPLSFKTFKR